MVNKDVQNAGELSVSTLELLGLNAFLLNNTNLIIYRVRLKEPLFLTVS